MSDVKGAASAAPSQGAAMIAAERQRQIDVEGWTPEHDEQNGTGGYDRGSALIQAAVAYAGHADKPGDDRVPLRWPWDDEWWKPKDPIRNLVRAGALIAAEIDRRLRAAPQAGNAAGVPPTSPKKDGEG